MRGRPLLLPQTVSTSTDATSPRVIKKTPSVHQRRTRRNMPMQPTNEDNVPNHENETQQQSPSTKTTILVPNRRRY